MIAKGAVAAVILGGCGQGEIWRNIGYVETWVCFKLVSFTTSMHGRGTSESMSILWRT